MILRNLEDVNSDIEKYKKQLIELKMEKSIILFCKIYNITQQQLNKITDLTINSMYEEMSPSEYALYTTAILEIMFKRGGVQRKFKIKYDSRSPDDDGDRYNTSYDIDIDCTHENDAILKNIYNTVKEYYDDGDEDCILKIIEELNN